MRCAIAIILVTAVSSAEPVIQRSLKEQAPGVWKISASAAQHSVSHLVKTVSKVLQRRRLQQCSCKWSDVNGKCENSNPMVTVMKKSMECSSKSSGDCSGDCEWKADENKCDLNGAIAMQMMMGGAGDTDNPMAALASKAMECSSKSSGDCSGDCEWKADENKCDLNGAIAMQMMMGGEGGASCEGLPKSKCGSSCTFEASAAPAVLLSFPLAWFFVVGGIVALL